MASLFFYHLYALISRMIWLLFTRTRRHGFEFIEDKGCVLASNHVSHFDPPLIGAYPPYKLDFMAMKELFSNPVGDFFLRLIDAFPVDRSTADMKAVRTALQRLKDGRIVCLFPEGGIRSGGESVLGGHELPKGAATLALMAKVPVRPCVIVGSDQLYAWQNWFCRPVIFIAVGDELEANPMLPKHEAIEDLNRRITESMREMFTLIQQQPEYSDKLASRTAQQRWAGQ
ncbi:MAG: 1-acyl-sn-glycerol-3-phosphate acyltransferase [Verrucomicrobiales bacterium]|jgi:1-acyl-sn-glycerol-3-phosphate acyltransferase|nr:1-acyl-sn-glycerol-3-phosphate acyltransferase [Verrucomicrobiales bacterium]